MKNQRLLILGCLLLIALSGLAMIFYKGGHPNNLGAPYSLSQNFLSDLGLTKDYNHQPLLISNIFFALSLLTASLTIGYFFSTQRSTKVIGGIASISILGIGALPSDIFFWPHRIALLIAFITITLGFIFLAHLNRRDKALTLLTSIMILYIAYLFLGPMPDQGEIPRQIHAILQKCIVYGTFIYIIFAVPKYIKNA